MNATYHAVEVCHGNTLANSKGLRRMPFSHYACRGSLALTVMAAALLLIGCQSTPHGNQPPPSNAPGGKGQVTILPPDHSRKPISPAAWKVEADRWLGVKYRKGGQGRSGTDCSGLASQMYLAVAGISLPRTTQDQSRCGSFVSRTDLRPGDLIFFITLKEKQVDHVGVYLGDAKFVHASASKGVVISSLLQDYYMQRYHSARRVIL